MAQNGTQAFYSSLVLVSVVVLVSVSSLFLRSEQHVHFGALFVGRRTTPRPNQASTQIPAREAFTGMPCHDLADSLGIFSSVQSTKPLRLSA